MNKNMKVLFFTLAVLMNAFKSNDATVAFWDYAASSGAGASADCPSSQDKVTITAVYNGFLAYPTVTSACAASCTAETTTTGTVAAGSLVTTVKTCETATAGTGAAAQPAVAKCITGTDLTISSTLTTTVDCAAGNKFCKNAYTATTTGGYKVTATCEATCGPASATLGCAKIASSNAILGCYVGIYYSSPPSGTSSSFNKEICAADKNQFCRNVYTWTSANGYQIDGSCQSTCSYTAISLTGSGTTAGQTCTTTVFGNTSGSPTLISSGIVMLIMLFLTCQGC